MEKQSNILGKKSRKKEGIISDNFKKIIKDTNYKLQDKFKNILTKDVNYRFKKYYATNKINIKITKIIKIIEKSLNIKDRNKC